VIFFKFLKQVLSEFGENKVGVLSAAFAYTAIFAIGPLLLIIVSIVGFIYGEKAASGQLFSQLSGVVGADAAQSIQNTIAHTHQSGANILALILGIIGTLLAAAGLSSQLQNAFNIIFDAVPDPKSGIKRTLYTKIKNIVLLIGAGLVIIVSIVLSTVVSALGHRLQNTFNLPPVAIELLNSGVSLLIFIGILFLIYKVLPDVYVPKKVTLAASVVISLLFVIGKIVLGLIIGKNSTSSAYGAAASVIVLLLWFYYAAQILLIGAVGMKVYGDNLALVYKTKKYTLKRRRVNLDLDDNLKGRLIEKFIIGYKKSSNSKKQ
jgi:membrane protein